jgi:ribosomal protein S6
LFVYPGPARNDNRMNTYELTVVIPGNASAQKKKSAQETVEKLIKINQGKISEMKDLGKIELAYVMAKNDTGQFMLFNVELEPEGASAMNNRLRAEDEFIRYLLVKQERSKSQEPKTKQVKKVAATTSSKS